MGDRPVVLAVANFKGGVGKTTTAAALADIWSSQHRVFAVDTDPQGDLTLTLGVNAAAAPVERTFAGPVAAHMDGGGSHLTLAEVAVEAPGVGERLTLVPANRHLARLIKAVESAAYGLLVVQRTFTHDPIDADIVVVDVPPTASGYVAAVLLAADAILIPVVPDILAFKAAERLVEDLNRAATVREGGTPAQIGMVLTQQDRVTVMSREAGKHVRTFADRLHVFDTAIPRTVRVPDTAATGTPVTRATPHHPVSVAYRSLAAEIMAWLSAKELT